MSLKFAALGSITVLGPPARADDQVQDLRPVGLHEAPPRPPVRGFLLNATNPAYHYGVVAKSFDAPGLAPGQRRLIMTVQQRPIGLSKWLGALCLLLAAFGRLWRLGIAAIPDALLAIHTGPSTATATRRSRPS
jgi:hypothetical protein